MWAVCRKYGILNEKQLRNWIKWYNGHKEFKERSAAKGEIYMTKGRKTTQEERAEIVAFCIEHNKDYGLTVETNRSMPGCASMKKVEWTNSRTTEEERNRLKK